MSASELLSSMLTTSTNYYCTRKLTSVQGSELKCNSPVVVSRSLWRHCCPWVVMVQTLARPPRSLPQYCVNCHDLRHCLTVLTRPVHNQSLYTHTDTGPAATLTSSVLCKLPRLATLSDRPDSTCSQPINIYTSQFTTAVICHGLQSAECISVNTVEGLHFI